MSDKVRKVSEPLQPSNPEAYIVDTRVRKVSEPLQPSNPEVVGTVSEGVYDLKSIFSKVSFQTYKGMTIRDDNYVVEDLPIYGYHIATNYDIGITGDRFKRFYIPRKNLLNSEVLQKDLDALLMSNDLKVMSNNLKVYMIYNKDTDYIMFWHYNREMYHSLNDIVSVMYNIFYLEMGDHWSREDYILSKEYNKKLSELKSEFHKLYNELPDWKDIDDVAADRVFLRRLLNR